MRDYSQEINAAVRQLGSIALDEARRCCPVRTGRLRDSIRLTEVRESASGKASQLVSTAVDYARYVELGSRKIKPANFLGSAAEKARADAPFVLKLYIGGAER